MEKFIIGIILLVINIALFWGACAIMHWDMPPEWAMLAYCFIMGRLISIELKTEQNGKQ